MRDRFWLAACLRETGSFLLRKRSLLLGQWLFADVQQVPCKCISADDDLLHKSLDDRLGNVLVRVKHQVLLQLVSQDREPLVIVGDLFSRAFRGSELCDLLGHGLHPLVNFRLHAQELRFVDLAVCPHGDEIVQALFQLGQLRLLLLKQGCVVLGFILVPEVLRQHLLSKLENAVGILEKPLKQVLGHHLELPAGDHLRGTVALDGKPFVQAGVDRAVADLRVAGIAVLSTGGNGMPDSPIEGAAAGTDQQLAPDIERRLLADASSPGLVGGILQALGLHHFLHTIEFVLRYDRCMSAPDTEAFDFAEVVDLLLLQKVRDKLLVIFQYTCIERVLQYLADVGFVPLR